jgi:hypothetical protein
VGLSALAGIAAMDLFVVPTISFRLLYGLLIVGMVAGRFYGLASQRVNRRGVPTPIGELSY